MRNVTLIATKDHLVYVMLADSVGEELTVTELSLSYTQNGSGIMMNSTIGFGVQGSGNTFHYINDEWNHLGEYVTPLLESRYNANTETMVPFGAVATSNNAMYIGVVPKEDSVSPSLVDYTKEVANTAEIGQFQQNTNTAFQLFKICQFDVSRDVDTFEKLEEVDPTIPDSEVTII